MDTPDRKQNVVPPILSAAFDLMHEKGKRFSIPVTGSSMLPLLQPGDRVLLSPGSANIHRGDIIVFWRDDRLLIHRVIRIYGDTTSPTFLTKGDNAREFDAPAHAEQIIGRVVTIKRAHQHISLDTRTWRVWGWLVAIVTSIGAHLIDSSIRLKRKLLGPQPNRFTTLLRRIVSTPFNYIFKILTHLFVRASQTSNDRDKHEND